MKLLEFLEKYGDTIFRGYWCGGADGSHKKRKGRVDPKLLEYALKNFPWLLGALHPHIAVTDYDTKDAFDCRVRIAKAKKEHCIAIESARGGHVYHYDEGCSVKTSNTKNRTLLSFYPVDYKLGYKVIKSTGEVKQADNYACLSKEDKSLRELVYCNIKEDGSLDEIPFYDLRVNASERYSFFGMKEGDGRQEGLFTYMNPVKAAGYSYEQFKEAAELIEQFVFAVPLGDEFENAVRREAWDNAEVESQERFFSGKTFLHDKFSEHIKALCHIIKINGQLHIYENGVYVSGYEPIERAMIKEIPSLTDAKRKEVLKYLSILIRENTKAEDANLIAFSNGLYNIVDDSFVAFTPEHIITNKIRWDYNPEAYSELADDVLNRIACGDPQIRALLEEAIGYCFYRRNELGKAFILTGDKSNGKSTFLSMVQTLLGEENIASLDLKELGDRFKTAEMFGKLANIGDDIGDEFIANPAIFKKLVTGERVSAERKGQNPFEFNNYSKLLFSANNIPRIKDKTGAVQRRLTIIPFDARFSADDPNFDPYIKHKLKSAETMEYLINIAIAGLKRVLTNKQFTASERVQKAMDEYEENNNPILGFFKECEDEEFQIENEPTNKVYKRYQEYCLANSLQAESKNMFSRQLRRWKGLEVGYGHLPGGKTIRIYCKK